MIASAQAGNEAGVLNAIGSLYRAAAMFATNKENFVAESGDWRGTQINSSNMLWSLSGALSLTFRVFAGMRFEADALHFAPVVPKAVAADRMISGFRYRNAVLNIEIKGYGDRIRLFEVDGVPQEEHSISADMTGHHKVKIVLSGSFEKNMKVSLKPGVCTPMTPKAVVTDGVMSWEAVEGVEVYEVYVAGIKVAQTQGLSIEIADEWNGDISVVARSADGVPSFPSEPILMVQNTAGLEFNPVFVRKADEDFAIDVEVPEDGLWYVSWVYSNGNGDITTDRKCAIRTLYVDGRRVDVCVFPQRGVDNWDEWGRTSPLAIQLEKGKHTFMLRFEAENDNMHIDINDFRLKGLELTCRMSPPLP